MACTRNKYTHSISATELDAKDARIRDLEEYTSVSLTVGGGHVVYGSVDAIARAQMYVLLDSNHPVEAKDTARYFAGALQKAEAELDALRKDAARFQAVMIISQASLCLPSTRTDEANRMLSAYQAAVNAGLGIEPAIDAAVQERQS
jgi:hypothetical protein